MENKIRVQSMVFRDGVGQPNRSLTTLNPNSFVFDQKTTENLLLFSQDLSKHFRFYDLDSNGEALANNLDPIDLLEHNWLSLFIENPERYKQLSDADRQIYCRTWIKEVIAYVDTPDALLKDEEKKHRLSQPHLALFIAFLKLLKRSRNEMNLFTERHLNFYYEEALQLTQKEAIPDQVNVIVELAKEIEQQLIPKSTTLKAGKDASGKEQLYQTTKDVLINKGEVAELKSLFVHRNRLSIRNSKEVLPDVSDAYDHMLRLALGENYPLDALPKFPDGINSLDDLKEALETSGVSNLKTISTEYVLNELYFETIPSFIQTVAVKNKDINQNQAVTAAELDFVYLKLEEANKKKLEEERKNRLHDIRTGEGVNSGSDALLKYVYGFPESFDELPSFEGNVSSTTLLYQALTDADTTRVARAKNYISEELYLKETGFRFIHTVVVAQSSSESDWKTVYQLLERAQRSTRNIVYNVPEEVIIRNIYHSDDPKKENRVTLNADNASKHWRTFGQRTQVSEETIGMFIASQALELSEGNREIAIHFKFKEETYNRSVIEPIFQNEEIDKSPFSFYLSSEKEWIKPNSIQLEFGDFVCGSSGDVMQLTINTTTNRATRIEGKLFLPQDIDDYILHTDNKLYRITRVISNDEIEVEESAQITASKFTVNSREESNAVSKRIKKEKIFLNGMKFILSFTELAPPICLLENDPLNLPMVKVLLNQLSDSEETESYIRYQELKDIELDKVGLEVKVSGIKSLTLQNDFQVLDSKKPVELFGSQPEENTSFYLTHRELTYKNLDCLKLNLEWNNTPVDFVNHYQNYYIVNPDIPVSKRVVNDSSLKIEGIFVDRRLEASFGSHALFEANPLHSREIHLDDLEYLLELNTPSFNYDLLANQVEGEGVLDWSRYLKFRLKEVDFHHHNFSETILRQARLTGENRNLPIPPPYTPKLKKISVDYSASEVVHPGKTNVLNSKIYLKTPYGYEENKPSTETGGKCFLLPQYRREGYLYAGIKGLSPGESINLLVQMAEGSANPDVVPPKVFWEVLRENDWIALSESDILEDGTNGLINSGIISFILPKIDESKNTLLQNDLFWIRASIEQDIDGIANSIDLIAQAVSLEFNDKGNDPLHYEQFLAPNSIKSTAKRVPEIKSIQQPFSSEKGKPKEAKEAFNQRISERLRHKNRGVTIWDYERLVLEEFPEIYKAKCIAAGSSNSFRNTGNVKLVVIPDIKGKFPFNPFEPKAPASTLLRIKKFINKKISPFSNLEVINPNFIQIKTRFFAKFKDENNTSFYRKKLEEDIKRFLSPWAFNKEEPIVIGGKIYANQLVNYIDKLDYVDFITKLKIFQSNDGEIFRDVRLMNNGENNAVANEPDAILVTADEHQIDLIGPEGYSDTITSGINYMQIGLDFQVTSDI